MSSKFALQEMGVLTDKELENKAAALTRAIARKIREERRRQRLSVYSLAKSVGVSEATVRNVEAEKNMNVKTLIKVLSGLGITPTIIL